MKMKPCPGHGKESINYNCKLSTGIISTQNFQRVCYTTGLKKINIYITTSSIEIKIFWDYIRKFNAETKFLEL